MTSEVDLSIHRVRPIAGRDEALEYLREMCTYWYQNRPAFPGTPENLFLELARQLPSDGAPRAAAPQTGPVGAAHPTALLQLFAIVERVIRTNPGGPYVDQLADTLARVPR